MLQSKFYTFSFIAFLLSICLVQAQDINTLKVQGVRHPVLSLNGIWKFNFQETAGSPENKANAADWKAIQIPGEPAMQGFAVKFDEPMLYKRVIKIPSDFRGKRVIIRFDGVYSYARLWINGKYLRDHQGGFTRWESDITNAVTAGKNCTVTLEVTDKKDDISYESGYAKHCIGGILRDVSLYALPEDRINNVSVETDFDADYTNASLSFKVFGSIKDKANVKFSLTDPNGKLVVLDNNNLELTKNNPRKETRFEIDKPLKWDSEHPNLYTLTTEVWVGDRKQYAYSQRIGFRKVVINGNRLLVNGQPVKLRGACRHDINPLLGRMATDEYDKLDAEIAKQANINFIRTSHYPPTQRFVEYCNEMGIYLESESAVCFVNTNRTSEYNGVTSTESSEAYTKNYMSQLEEMASTLRNEPSVIIWSIGNESKYGINFQKSYDWLKQNDKTRPVIFSYPGIVPAGQKAYDLLSMHYPEYTGNLKQYGLDITDFNNYTMPVLFDEWAHVPCYVNDILREDPNIREFWGKSLDLMWQGAFEAKGGLGGAIWGMIDETFMLPDTTVGYGEWGIVDTWRRKKPEFWSTRKAYSPVRLLETNIEDFTSGHPLQVPVYNRFDHTLLDEVKLTFNYKGKTGTLTCPAIAPHTKGLLTLPVQNWSNGDIIQVSFSRNNILIDEYDLTLGKKATPADAFVPEGQVDVKETADSIVVQGRNFHYPFNKKNGLLNDAKFNGEIIIHAGPYLNFAATEANPGADWKLGQINYTSEQGYATIHISGQSKDITVEFIVRINGNGDMAVNYQADHLPGKLLKESGVKFTLPGSYDRLLWNRESYWSYYPKGDFGAPEGSVALYKTNSTKDYRKHPKNEWQFDDRNFYYFGVSGTNSSQPLTNVAKSMKENINSYQLFTSAGSMMEVLSPKANTACRVNKNIAGELTLYVNTSWDYPEIGWGDYSKHIPVRPQTGIISLRFKK
ncbi:MAG: ebgA 1 [Mucilaginibacter sp.]|nr:ebgA 1 [Mucilaginibacter sp.]